MTWEMEFNAKKCYVLEMEKRAMRPSWAYKFGKNIISIAKEEKSLSGNTGQLITIKTYRSNIW